MKRLSVLLYNDLKNLIREPLLFYIILFPPIFALLLRYLIPLASVWIKPYFVLEQYYSLISGMFILFPPMMTGMVIGFLLLDERDDNTLTVLMVTPMPRSEYIMYRVSAGMIISFVYDIVLLPVIGLASIPYIYSIPAALAASLEAPVMALFLAVFAGNKVEGLALSKGTGFFTMIPLTIYLIPSRWRPIAGIFPSYWPVKILVESSVGSASIWLYIVTGLILHILYIYLLLKKFEKKII